VEELILQIITKIQRDKKKANRFPDYAIHIDIMAILRKEAERTLESLVENGIVTRTNTFNSCGYSLTQKEQN